MRKKQAKLLLFNNGQFFNKGVQGDGEKSKKTLLYMTP